MSHTAAVGIAVAQFRPGTDPEENLSSMRALADRAVELGAAVVVFPEYSSYFRPDMDASFAEHAQPVDGPFVESLGRLARTLGIHVVAGLVERTGIPDHFANALVALGPDGALEAVYRKIHLYDAFGQRESDWVVPGVIATPETFVAGGLRFGLQTCYDLRFPESTRRLVDAGADVVLIPSEWVRGPLKEHHWRTLLTARAIENTVYVAAADHSPPIGVGASMIVDPMGVQLAGLGEEDGVIVAHASTDRIAAVRAVNPALELRRFVVAPR
ncbi:carbon-nitrogen hydrolase family protein [Plantibacter sp. YIM 135347]|jgi:predicted amidohydrolase|uniref:carbon-nitrogen hydrolase family protein n=1 Tax=Plantibacter sp. YIM 135347 TaxID=3423919 RepID=UPI003D334495